MTLLVAELSAPALFVAGATTSLHCALMCGAINVAQVRSQGAVPLRQTLALVHGGRVLGYALLGLLAGAMGGQLALWLPEAGSGTLQLLASLTLVVAGAQQWRGPRKKGVGSIFPCHGAGATKMDPTPFSPRLPPRARLFAQGLLWALMPCGILYTVVLLAGLTASPPAGLVLLAAFGLGTVPLMGVSGGLFGLAVRPQGLRHAAGAVLVVLGLAGAALAALSPEALMAVLCRPV